MIFSEGLIFYEQIQTIALHPLLPILHLNTFTYIILLNWFLIVAFLGKSSFLLYFIDEETG